MEKMRNPEIEVIKFDNQEIITTSTGCDCVNGFCAPECDAVGAYEDCPNETVNY